VEYQKRHMMKYKYGLIHHMFIKDNHFQKLNFL
jgi:hypothetical protein